MQKRFVKIHHQYTMNIDDIDVNLNSLVIIIRDFIMNSPSQISILDLRLIQAAPSLQFDDLVNYTHPCPIIIIT